MRIDRIGDNQPLYFESMDQDGIFQAGETWQFIVQDCVTPPNPCFFYTPDEVGDGDPLPSIIVPEPAGLALSLLGGLLVLRRRR
jgi:MYXO-CTERM domain-containing protein